VQYGADYRCQRANEPTSQRANEYQAFYIRHQSTTLTMADPYSSPQKEITADPADPDDTCTASDALAESLLSSSSCFCPVPAVPATAAVAVEVPPEEEQPEPEPEPEREEDNSSPPSHARAIAIAIASTSISQRRRPLAWMRSTPLLAKLLIPLLIVSNHVIFYYGQTVNMWRLTGSWHAHIEYKVVSVEAKTAFQALKIHTTGSYTADSEKDLRVFTYAYAIQELWKAEHMPGVFVPRLAAVGLIGFSGLWPHVKLIMLLFTWWFVTSPKRRRSILSCLSLFGKWSLVDVLTVVVLVGVLNLDWHFTAESLVRGVMDHLPNLLGILSSLYTNDQICARALGYSCQDPKNIFHVADCKICMGTVSEFLQHPSYARKLLQGIEFTGSGHGQMAVSGLSGIYAFCGAVILSICLSFIVDYCDFCRRSTQQESNEEHRSRWPEVSGTLTAFPQNENRLLAEPLLNQAERGDVRSDADREHDRRILLERQQFSNTVWECVAWLTAIVVWLASACISMQRRVSGALPSLMKSVLGIEWIKQYSFWSLGWTTSKAGGWDFMLMATFVWFVIVGPLVRSFLAIRASRQVERPEMTPIQSQVVRRRRERLTTWIDFVGAFCAWEVFSISALMVNLLMPSITNTIIMDPRCQMLTDERGSCMEVESGMTWVFALVITGYFLLSLVSWRARTYEPATAS
jgi:hypothetical protein